ncbi:50S ribosomal protein L15 [Patescibacteria group bacterium]|nr:50S ribosomal protein L15 [Patescibacteria group bacterium]
MKLDELKPAKGGSTKNTKRLGRGPGTGWGRTSGRGNKGAGQRSGYKNRAWFEGGQMPILRRLPKRGFSNYGFRKEFQIVNLSTLELLDKSKIDANILAENGIVKSAFEPIKILGNGDITKSIEITASAFSKTSIEKIEKAGGKAIVQ